MSRGEVRNPVVVLLLTMVTCGIYGVFWFFKVSEEVNQALGEERFSPVKELVLSLVTCGAWGLWWQWRLSEATVELQQSRGLSPNLEPVVLFLTGFAGLFPFFVQNALNNVWEQGSTAVVGAGRASGAIGGGTSGGGTSGGAGASAPTEREPAEMQADWLDRFEAMVAEMQEHPRVAITHHWVGEPATNEAFAEVEAELGFELDDRIKTFYKMANGLQFRWMDKLGNTYVESRDGETVTQRQTRICGDNDDAVGVIDILPLRETFVDADYEDITWFDWMADSETEFRGEEHNLLEFSKSIRPFDPFSFYNSTAFYIGDGEPGKTVIMGDDHDATFTDSRITDLASYLELVLAHRGQPQARREELGTYAGHREPRVVLTRDDFDQSPVPLDQILPDRSDMLTDADLEGDKPARVSFETSTMTGSARGTVLGVKDAPTSPRFWDRPTEFAEVDFDLGGKGYVVRRSVSVIREPDMYERAFADPSGYFAQVAGADSQQRANLIGKIGGGSASSTMYQIETDDGEIELLVNAHAPRFLGITDQLDRADAIKVLLDINDALLEDGLNASFSLSGSDDAYDEEEFERLSRVDVNDMVGMFNGVIGVLLMEQHQEQPYDTIADAFGDEIASRIGSLVDRLDGETVNHRPLPMLEFFQAALESFPGETELQVRRLGGGSTSDQFGLDDAQHPVLSG